MGKIEALKQVDDEILRTVQRIERNTLRVNKADVYYLVDRYNQCNTSGYTYKEVDVCNDCRSYVLRFWQNVVIEWRKTKPTK